MAFMCVLAGHRRSARRAKLNHETEGWESVCKSCGAPMLRIGEGDWRLKSDAEQRHHAEAA
jgi:hypothetical protein